jgi:CobQ-like glutamine amidotransferase family enzyme/UDP-N-acetylmuramyl tripeptide synthase
LGGGSMIGGRVGLAVSPDLLARLGASRTIALVSGTNGKTTTTRLLAEALGGPEEVATSVTGANMPAGIVTALAAGRLDRPAVLEVDEAYLPRLVQVLAPEVIVLLNLSRDQLDRVSEVRMVAESWREALAGSTAVVVANADDPLVVYAAGLAREVEWVAAGGLWHRDAYHCPLCGEHIAFSDAPGEGWSCRCGFARPKPTARLADDTLTTDSGSLALHSALPGRFNAANAAMAAVAAEVLGVDLRRAVGRIGVIDEVAGRFSTHVIAGRRARLLLAKNPAGWTEMIDLVRTGRGPVVIAINARLADGHDPSWLWDVPFELLANRPVVASGERRRDLAVRLRHAGVTARLGPVDPIAACSLADGEEIDVIANYTAFQEIRRRTGRRRPRTAGTARRTRVPSSPSSSAPAPPDSRTTASVDPSRPSALRIVIVHPDLLGTYGDTGNGIIVANRARWRGLSVDLVYASSDEELPTAGDLYLLGGGEDGPQSHSAELLCRGALSSAVAHGAAVFAVCAGYQIIGTDFPGVGGARHGGVGLLDVTTIRPSAPRAVGELVVEADLAALRGESGGAARTTLTGFENHAGHSLLGGAVRPFGTVSLGVGNGATAHDGAVAGRVIGTYLHGPALARNVVLADALLAMLTGTVPTALDDETEWGLWSERIGLARRAARRARTRRGVVR